MRDALPPHHQVLEQTDMNSNGCVAQTIRINDGSPDPEEYTRMVHAEEAYFTGSADAVYQRMLHHILEHGCVRPDRTGTGTLGVFGYQARFDLSEGAFPLLTTKAMGGQDWKNIVVELIWFLRGDTNIRFLVQHGVHIWTDWPLKHYNATMALVNKPPIERAQFEAMVLHDPEFAAEWGDCGPIYGAQWRKWKGALRTAQPEFTHGNVHTLRGHVHVDYEYIDQLQEAFNELATNPFSRRHVVNAWNPTDIPAMIPRGLPPCHCLFQFNVRAMTMDEREKHSMLRLTEGVGMTDESRHHLLDAQNAPRYYLDCQMYQRSADAFLGVPYNIASYSLLTMVMAQQLGYVPGEFVHTFGDLHIYSNHMNQVQTLLQRAPNTAPRVHITPRATFDEYEPDDFSLIGYTSHSAIRAPVAV